LFCRAGISSRGSWNGSADFKETRVALIAAARCLGAAMFGFALQLLLADHRQYRA